MKQLTDEQYYQIGVGIHENGETLTQNASDLRARAWLTALGRAAYAASFPRAVAEACEEPNEDECDALEGKWGAPKPDFSYSIKLFMRDRLARLTVKPDAAVEAVKALTINWMNMKLTDGSAREVVAAVDAARAKEAK